MKFKVYYLHALATGASIASISVAAFFNSDVWVLISITSMVLFGIYATGGWANDLCEFKGEVRPLEVPHLLTLYLPEQPDCPYCRDSVDWDSKNHIHGFHPGCMILHVLEEYPTALADPKSMETRKRGFRNFFWVNDSPRR